MNDNTNYPKDDLEFRATQVEKVDCTKTGWTITCSDKWMLHVSVKHGVTPIVGQVARFYGQIGNVVRGLYLDHQKVFYYTIAQQERKDKAWLKSNERKQKLKFSKNRLSLNQQYDSLPDVFKRRIDRFRSNNPDFRWKYESYEMFTCKEAIKIANALDDSFDPAEFYKLSFKEQNKLVPDLSDEHSGNTFGMALQLAYLYKTNPEGVAQIHGALAPLVGSKEYGDISADAP